MITFQEDGYTITVKTPGNPVEDWLQTQRELIDLFICKADDADHNHPNVLDLILEMMPSLEQANKMVE